MSECTIDNYFEKILVKLLTLAIETTGKCTQEVLKLSEECLDEKAHDTVSKFYNLYFSDNLEKTKNEINQETDDLINQAMEQKEAGLDINIVSSQESEEKRLGLSSMQKELEGLITLDQGMKEQLMPVLSSMQFEDSVRQRLEHIIGGWKDIFFSGCNDQNINFKAIEKILSSVEETADFYQCVLKKDPPECAEKEGDSILFF